MQLHPFFLLLVILLTGTGYGTLIGMSIHIYEYVVMSGPHQLCIGS